ncbi:MAG: DUF433 domain-containing protein [Chloroflexota bacterium]|nr:DUF433 domain-containing protein [Chloroflexota bacterium]
MQEEWIVSDPNILYGTPVIVGTEISVEWLARQVCAGYSIAILIDAFPELTPQAILAAVAWHCDRRGGRYFVGKFGGAGWRTL